VATGRSKETSSACRIRSNSPVSSGRSTGHAIQLATTMQGRPQFLVTIGCMSLDFCMLIGPLSIVQEKSAEGVPHLVQVQPLPLGLGKRDGWQEQVPAAGAGEDVVGDPRQTA
jgi:hypothetical protein